MAGSYFIKRGEKVIGPMAPDALKDRIGTGKIRATDQIGSASAGPWKPITDVRGLAKLFDPPPKQSSGNLTECEDCGGSMSKRAAICPRCGAPTTAQHLDERESLDDFYGDDSYGDDSYGDDSYGQPLLPPPAKQKQSPQVRVRKTSRNYSTESGTPIFVLGLVGFFMIPICLPIAWIMGNSYLNRCNTNDEEPDDYGKWGRLLGKVGTLIWLITLIVGIIFVCLFIVAAVGSAAAVNTPTLPPVQVQNDTVDDVAAVGTNYDQLKANTKAHVLRFKCNRLAKRNQLDSPAYSLRVTDVATKWFPDAGFLNAEVVLESPKVQGPIVVTFRQEDARKELVEQWQCCSVSEFRCRQDSNYKHFSDKLKSVFYVGLKI
jgi:hypothetical protein